MLSLEFAAVTGGPLKAYISELLDSGAHVVWQTRLSFYSEAAGRRALEEARAWLRATPGTLRLNLLDGDAANGELARLAEARPVLVTETMTTPRGPLAWIAEIAPEFLSAVNAKGFHLGDWLEAYELERGAVLNFAWDDLRYFAAFLRKSGHDALAFLFHLEYSRAHVLFSPQDEETEAASLKTDQFMLNPTVQLIQCAEPAPRVIALARRIGLSELELEPAEAALIDELNENGRMSGEALLAGAGRVFGDQAAALQLEDARERLLQNGILIQGRS